MGINIDQFADHFPVGDLDLPRQMVGTLDAPDQAGADWAWGDDS